MERQVVGWFGALVDSGWEEGEEGEGVEGVAVL